jgi:hypothetical protein
MKFNWVQEERRTSGHWLQERAISNKAGLIPVLQ